MFITKTRRSKIAGRTYRRLKIVVFYTNGVAMQPYELSEQLQRVHLNMALLSMTHLKPRLLLLLNSCT
jgi:hypothetical protein